MKRKTTKPSPALNTFEHGVTAVENRINRRQTIDSQLITGRTAGIWRHADACRFLPFFHDKLQPTTTEKYVTYNVC